MNHAGRILSVSLLTATVAAANGCGYDSRQAAAPSAATPNESGSDTAHPIWGPYLPVAIQVLDARTSTPIQGAELSALCLGVDFRSNTDADGRATIMHHGGEMLPVAVSAPGYQEISSIINRSDAVLRLNRKKVSAAPAPLPDRTTDNP